MLLGGRVRIGHNALVERPTGDRDWVAFVVGGAFLLGLVTALLGPVGGWDNEGWLTRAGLTALGGIGGAVFGWRVWCWTDDD